jgi:hypothetical protein
MVVSQTFIVAVKMASEPAYKIAYKAGIHPSVLSKLISGQERLKPHDARVLAVGKVLGLTAAECFEEARRTR